MESRELHFVLTREDQVCHGFILFGSGICPRFPGLDDLAKNIVELAKNGAPDESMVNAIESIRAIATWKNCPTVSEIRQSRPPKDWEAGSILFPTTKVRDMKGAVNDSHAVAQQLINQKAREIRDESQDCTLF